MRKLRIWFVASAVAVLGLVGTASPASASRCDESIEDACRTAAIVICQVIAKGQPCLN